MRIAVIDVAAESGGALSVLRDFLSYVSELNDEKNEYFVFVSKEVEIVNPHIHYILKPEIKRSWISRLKWERVGALKELDELNIDVVFSLQNTALFSKKRKQIVYFHNVLLLEPKTKYSLWKKAERLYGIYTRVIAPYTLNSLKNADVVICQTNTVKNEIQRRLPGTEAVAVNPNVSVEDAYLATAVRPIKGFLYPTAPVPFKRIEETVACVRENKDWFDENHLEFLITVNGSENAYAQTVYAQAQGISCIRFIGYQKRETILALYRDHALLINSELESFPLPFQEAELVGAPVIAADYPYAQEILANTEGAAIYRKHDTHDMFEKMKWALSHQRQKKQAMNREINTWHTVMQAINGQSHE